LNQPDPFAHAERLKPEHLAADTAYGSAEMLNWLVNEKGIAPHIPVIDKSKRHIAFFVENKVEKVPSSRRDLAAVHRLRG
jgi:hypothetical protein